MGNYAVRSIKSRPAGPPHARHGNSTRQIVLLRSISRPIRSRHPTERRAQCTHPQPPRKTTVSSDCWAAGSRRLAITATAGSHLGASPDIKDNSALGISSIVPPIRYKQRAAVESIHVAAGARQRPTAYSTGSILTDRYKQRHYFAREFCHFIKVSPACPTIVIPHDRIS